MTLSEKPESTIRGLLETNWNPNNTSGWDPTLAESDDKWLIIHTGWYDAHPSDPQVTCTRGSESTIGGGTSGYSFMQGDGSGPGQRRSGVVRVGCWDGRDSNDASTHPDDLVFELQQEVVRIITDHAQGVAETPIHTLSPDETTVPDDTDVTPTVYREEIAASYVYDR